MEIAEFFKQIMYQGTSGVFNSKRDIETEERYRYFLSPNLFFCKIIHQSVVKHSLDIPQCRKRRIIKSI